jgi:hypothetical protein
MNLEKIAAWGIGIAAAALIMENAYKSFDGQDRVTGENTNVILSEESPIPTNAVQRARIDEPVQDMRPRNPIVPAENIVAVDNAYVFLNANLSSLEGQPIYKDVQDALARYKEIQKDGGWEKFGDGDAWSFNGRYSDITLEYIRKGEGHHTLMAGLVKKIGKSAE